MWSERPTEIKNLNQQVEHIMFIDENGSSSNIISIMKKNLNGEEILEDEKYFTITGCIFEKNDYLNSKALINELKCKYWNNGKFYDNKAKKEKEVCFHSREIRKHDGCFNDSLINYNEFIVELTETMKDVKCKIISISIDLYEYLQRGYTHNVYNVAFDFLLEKYIFVTKNNRKGIIILEARGKSEDKELLKHIVKVINKTGTKKITNSELRQKINGVYFNHKWNDNYGLTYVGLEIADLFSYPIHKYIKINKKDKAFLCFEDKIFGYPNYINNGIKTFPKWIKK